MYRDLLKPTYLQTLCKEYGLNPSKKYGQNYLITDSPIKKMIEVAEINNDDTVIEIGPGFGVLTLPITEIAQKVISFEIEKKLENYWLSNKKENLDIVWGNVLNKIQEITTKIQNYKVVANLPYQITSNILRVLLELANKPKSITIMVQKEVADRICAKPGDMSILAVAVQYFGTPKIITKVPRGCFWPSPKVDSAILHIQINNNQNSQFFFQIVRAGFANKRKQLWHNLVDGQKLDREVVKGLLKDITGNELIRAEELSIEQWVKLTGKLSTSMT